MYSYIIDQSLCDYAHAVYQSIFCITPRKRLLANGLLPGKCIVSPVVREIVELVCYLFTHEYNVFMCFSDTGQLELSIKTK